MPRIRQKLTIGPDERGFVLVTTAVVMTVVFALSFALISYIVAGNKAGRHVKAVYGATQFADAGVQKAIHCLNASVGTHCGGTYGDSYTGETSTPIEGGYFTTVVTGTADLKTISSTGSDATGRTRTIIVDATTDPPTDDMDFSYAIQAGTEDVRLENNATITGTAYSNGEIRCQSDRAKINGDAYVSKPNAEIHECTVNGDAHADDLHNSVISGDAYFQDLHGATVAGTEFPGSPTPIAKDMPDIDLQFWRNSAEYGGTIWNDYAPADNESLGPVKINGNLLLNQNVDIIVTGPVWVTGNITTENNSGMTLSPSFNEYSTVVLADNPSDTANYGRITFVNNTDLAGSGHPNSHILLVSTNSSMSDTNPAMSIANNTAGALFFAMNGVLRLENNAAAKSLVGKRVFVDQRGEIDYGSGSGVDMEFANGPDTGRWRLLPGTWREAK